ncbi:hypothetical protein BSKO_04208 [Bryopsis sp. KO-2023]|nr:hypothetical protein BSKO_04208 [Bryopsis sp. KO-2023]
MREPATSGGPNRHRDEAKRYSPYEFRNTQSKRGRRDRLTSSSCSSSFESEMEEGPNCVKVSKASDVKKVAGRIAHSMRRDELPVVLSTGASSVNQAVKAAAIARKYLSEDDIGLAIQPAVRHGRKCSVAFQLRRSRHRKPFKHEVELTLSASSTPTTVAGALAARVREGVPTCLTGIGVDAIAAGVMAISAAREYLEGDYIDIKTCPEFIHVEKDGTSLSAMRFNILVEDL